MLESIREILRRRDNLSEGEIDALFEEFREAIEEDPEDPEELIQMIFGLEPDYLFDRELGLF